MGRVAVDDAASLGHQGPDEQQDERDRSHGGSSYLPECLGDVDYSRTDRGEGPV